MLPEPKKLLIFCLLAFPLWTFSQTEVDERAMIHFRKGLGFNAPDSAFGVNIRLRMQNRLRFNTDEAFSLQDIEARVSRLRLRFDGYILSDKITYYLQLSFSRGDQDWDNTHMANVVRDAMVYYRFNPNFYVGLGQGKLPGNRQRITSSGQQQFFDRSHVNANYTLDRDFGFFAYYSNNSGKLGYNIKAAVSTGEGRNQLKTDNGLMYTGRIELLPLGRFKRDGDFSEGDLEFEERPKVSIGLAYAWDGNALRTKGTTGTELYEGRDLSGFVADAIFKYRGWAFQSEFLQRSSIQSPFTYAENDSTLMAYALLGKGINTQLSYCFSNYWEIAARYAVSTPESEITHLIPVDKQYVLGVNKYLRKHLTKFQAFVGYRQQTFGQSNPKNGYFFGLQVELGI